MRIVLLLVTALALGANALAQKRPQLNVVVEELDQKAKDCGVTESQLESIAAL